MKVLATALIRTLGLGSLLFCLCGAAQADLASIRNQGRLRVGIAIGVPRFSYLDAKQELRGSDVDTAGILARDLGVRLEIVRTSNAGRLKTLETGSADIVISSLSITPERERIISFSPPYAKLFTVVAAHPSLKITGYADLANLRIGVTRLTSNAAQIEQHAPDAIMVPFDDDALLIKAAVAGKLDLLSSQQAVIDEINRQGANPPFEEKFVQKEFELAIGIPRSEKALRAWISDWVVENLRNGRLNDIYRRYHGRDLPPELRPNAKPRQAERGNP
ncbi:transporter substrate-binding domain-containing protein [Uliginosibacterium sp. 31-16]|uniref:transporter substrate-binding domain-containing protein n=1 Tax=Uliginosibacterium sp. 31-16 TaxID=3068315 RepID=UPI00273FF19B|nr:transporter substrate-binding domain-containing protein [Uliginosibacterium sp. 31-16]MDP5240589.1 transporter substrate-binding domain-containing protein [Uliginosibacterium sp. 31-16]